MTNLFPEEDWEHEPKREELYLQEEEHDLFLWYHENMKKEQGEIIYDNTEISEFIREGMES